MNRQLFERLRETVASLLTADEETARLHGRPLTIDEQKQRATSYLEDQLDIHATDQFGGHQLAQIISPEEEKELIQAVLDALYGLGPIQRLLADEAIENININGYDVVWVKKVGGVKEPGPPVADSDEDLIRLMQYAAAHLGPSERRFNPGSPQLDMRLPDGSRLSAVMSIAARPAISIRRHRLLSPQDASLKRLQALGAIDEGLRAFLAAAVRARKTIVVAGGTNAGKTTLVRALANEIPPHERLVTIEKSLELGLDQFPELHPDIVALEAREANVEGEGQITMSQMVRRGLRMDPDRVIVGEVLGDEVIDMLNAMSQGNDGSLCTIHANSSEGVFRRICSYAIQSAERLPAEATNLLIAGAVNLVVFIDQVDEREQGGDLLRFVSSVREVTGAEELKVLSKEVFRPSDIHGRAVPAGRPVCLDELVRKGYDATLFEKQEGFWECTP